MLAVGGASHLGHLGATVEKKKKVVEVLDGKYLAVGCPQGRGHDQRPVEHLGPEPRPPGLAVGGRGRTWQTSRTTCRRAEYWDSLYAMNVLQSPGEKLEVLRAIRARKASEKDSCVLGVRAWIPIAAPKLSLYRIMEENRQMSRTQATNVLTFRFNMI